MIKIIHTGDIHLDTPFSGLDPARAEVRKTELRGTFSALMTYIRMNAVDMLLIAGDFFDRGFVTRETVAIVLREFSRVPDCKIIISPGNHDPYTVDSVYAKVKFPENVYIFSDSKQQCFSFPELGVDVYGYAFTGEVMDECPIEPVPDTGRMKILCAHAHLGVASSPYAPVSAERLAACGFDYAALGHVHVPEPIAELDGCVYGYCGCLEGRDFGEVGARSAVRIEAEDGNFKMTRIVFTKKQYKWETLSVTGASSSLEIIERIKALIKEKHYATDPVTQILLRVTLTGELPADMVISEKVIEDAVSEVFAIEVKDETTAALDDEYLMHDPTVRGEFYRTLRPKLMSADPDERKLARRALRYGFSAMAGENITD